MTSPQPGIFALGSRAQHHLELDALPQAGPDAWAEAITQLGVPSVTAGGANLVVGFGAGLWRSLAPAEHQPADLGDFTTVSGLDGKAAPATQHDLWVWVHGSGADAVLDTVRAAAAALAAVATVVSEQACFVYRDSRDLTGFIDGTANAGPGEAEGDACVAAGAPGAGGSHVIAQRWVHDLAAFGALPVSEQEKVFGRTKLDSTELPDRPATAHISRAEIHDDAGEERPIFRRSAPYGSAREQGLFFLGFSAERDRFDQMLAAMFGTSGDGRRDRLLDFTHPVSGAYYFAPSLEALAAVASRGRPD